MFNAIATNHVRGSQQRVQPNNKFSTSLLTHKPVFFRLALKGGLPLNLYLITIIIILSGRVSVVASRLSPVFYLFLTLTVHENLIFKRTVYKDVTGIIYIYIYIYRVFNLKVNR